ncbi:MAG TPA: UDP-3-O-acyl-N-acetylglucosamine deacetylase, partial [bacterium]|nr:UDP-3-O-acyl-N-acetylglucosamine deacetylase [bacterium]
MKMLQRTVRERVEFSGVALHSGAEVSVVIKPAPEDTGILFTRADLPKKPSIHATWKNVVDTQMSTVLGNRRTRIATVEHLMSALRGLNIDNAFVEVYGPEVPILDGSSVSYIDALEAVGVIEQTKPVKYLQVLKPISVSIDDRFVY